MGGASTATLPDLHWKLLRPGTDAPRPDGESWYTELRKQASDGLIRLDTALASRLAAAVGYTELSAAERLALLLAHCNAAAPPCEVSELTHLDGTADAMVRARSELWPTDVRRRGASRAH